MVPLPKTLLIKNNTFTMEFERIDDLTIFIMQVNVLSNITAKINLTYEKLGRNLGVKQNTPEILGLLGQFSFSSIF